MNRPQWTTACPDWERRVVEGRSLIPFEPLFPAEAEAAREIFDGLIVADAGARPMRELCRPWMFDFVGSVFGAYDAETGYRLIQEVFLLISKKNMKSTGAAGVMLTALVRNWRQSAELLILSPTIEIANNSFGPARDMVKADEELADLFYVQDHLRTITHRVNGAQLKVVAADSEAVSGKKAGIVFVDELWLFGKNPKAQKMLLEATGGLTSRPEGCVIYASTMSDEPPVGVMLEKLTYARGVRDGRIVDPAFLPILYEFPAAMLKRDEHKDPKNFYVTNPNLGASVREDYLLREYMKAKETDEAAVQLFLSKHANVQIGLSMASNRWSGADFWLDAGRAMTLDSLLERSEVVVVGVDGGGLDDMLGLAVLGRERKTQKWLHWAHAWIHPVAIKRRPSEKTTYEELEKSGGLTVLDKLPGDVSAVGAQIEVVQGTGKLWGIGMDPEKTHKVMLAELKRRKISEKKIYGVSQGWHLMGSITMLERRLAEGMFEHCGQKLMAYSVGNAKIEPRGNAYLITKQISGTAKIDPLMATFDCVELMARNPAAAPDLSAWLDNPVIA